MKIRFIQSFATDRQTFIAGIEYDEPDEHARQCIAGGVAVEVAPPKEGKDNSMPPPVAPSAAPATTHRRGRAANPQTKA